MQIVLLPIIGWVFMALAWLGLVWCLVVIVRRETGDRQTTSARQNGSTRTDDNRPD